MLSRKLVMSVLLLVVALKRRKEDYTSLQPPRADWMDWQHPNNQKIPSQNVQHQQEEEGEEEEELHHSSRLGLIR